MPFAHGALRCATMRIHSSIPYDRAARLESSIVLRVYALGFRVQCLVLEWENVLGGCHYQDAFFHSHLSKSKEVTRMVAGCCGYEFKVRQT